MAHRLLEPRHLQPTLPLIDAATSWRSKALLTLMWRTGQRVGDWNELHGRHGLLGLALGDVDATGMTTRVVLKGARDEHLVPVTDDFWPLWDAYLRHERGDAPTRAAWVGFRRGRGQPLAYGAFEAALRHLGQQVGVRVTAHMFRHAFAQAVMNTAGLKRHSGTFGPRPPEHHRRHLPPRRRQGHGRRRG